jgi:hypothetical protein
MLFVAPGAPVGLTAPPRLVPMISLAGSGIRGPRDLLRGLRRQRALLAWNRAQPRPAAFRHCPDRVWQRRSALLTLVSGRPEPGGRIRS